PDVASPIEPGHALVHLNTALTNTLAQESGDYVAELDLEMLRTVIDLRYGLHSNVELGLELPFLLTYSGILDDFIEGAEKFFGRERRQRRAETKGQFVYQVLRGDRRFIQGRDNAFGIGDMVWKLKVRVWRERAWRPAFSLRAAVKLPTGSTSRALGSGEADASVGFLLQQSLRRLTIYVNGDVTFPGEAFEEASLQPFFAGMVAFEYRITRPVSLVAQFRGDTRPFHNTIQLLDRRILEVLLGLNWVLTRRVRLQAGVSEDVFESACCAADLSFFLNLTWRWSRNSRP
ncbi:MAG: DUF3187 family protein, partial [Candidatus Tectomicrobia bacterium]|nr:DUF3187 family protein [Candidatus Tectomicrobia bacterium]